MLSQRHLFLKHLAQTSEFPLSLEIIKAEGVWMHSKNSKYLDLISGIGVSNVGHRHPKVVEAIKHQADQYLHLMVYGEYIQTPQTKLAQLLSETTNHQLDSVYLVNSGSEATEGAIKLAKRYTGRTEIIAAKNAYHGATNGALSLSNHEFFTQAFRPLLPDIRFIEFNNVLDVEQISNKTAAVFLESIQGEAGVICPSNDYLKKIRERCNETGTLLILDEVQSGAGRTGEFWAFEHYNILPDIITTAKGLGGGMPIGAFISSKKIMQVLTHDPILGHITTFGGHPVSAAAASACLEVLKSEKLLATVEEKGQCFEKLLQHKAIKDIRRAGLMMAVELDSFENLQTVIQKCIKKGVVTDWFLFNDISMRIAPPLTISFEEIEFACSVIIEALNETY